MKLSDKIKAEASDLGFCACGIAKAEAVDTIHSQHMEMWTARGFHAAMEYMSANKDKRHDPTLLVEGAKSIICVALNYAPAQTIRSDRPQIAYYAYGKDYHDIMKQKLRLLAERCQLAGYRAFCDTAPVMERYWAWRAGLGWIGRNHMLTIPNHGNMTVIGVIITDMEMEYDQPQPDRCGECRRCIELCPTGALRSDGFMDANLCLSYQTIENRGPLSKHAAQHLGNNIFGCNECIKACPWSKKCKPTSEPHFAPSNRLMDMTAADWHMLTENDYRILFKGSAVKRAKYAGLKRNIDALFCINSRRDLPVVESCNGDTRLS